MTAVDTAAVPTDVRVDGARLLRRIEELARIGCTPEGGVTRPAFSAEDRAAQLYLRSEAVAAGLCVQVDPAGNVLVRRPRPARSPGPVVLIGSHLDTVIDGGRLDGAYGVLAALGSVQAIAEAGLRPPYEPVAVAFANEEGALFPQPFWGSMALAGQSGRLPAEPRDRHGNSLREPLRAAGGALDEVGRAAWPPASVKAYLELHIEQGPALERLGTPVGVVTGIVGRVAFDMDIRGRAGHAGTTPMTGRQDAAVAAGHVVLAVQRIATTADLCRVATAGRLSVSPDATNVVPGGAFVAVELRDDSPARLAAAEAELHAELAVISRDTGCEIVPTETVRTAPVSTDPALRDVIRASAAHLGLASLELPSGAGHDAQIMASMAPIGMIFVPSRDGQSHVPQEYSAPEDLVAGADVLLRAALSVDPRIGRE